MQGLQCKPLSQTYRDSEMKKLGVIEEEEENSLWSSEAFAETMGSYDMEEKKKTLHKKHDEDTDFSCKKCNAKISTHNKDWHGGMCDACFYKE